MWRPRKYGSTWFYPLMKPDLWGKEKYLESFNQIPELNAIISLKARAFSNGQIKAVNQKGEEVKDPYPGMLDNPNWFQSLNEFMMQTKLFREIYGNEYLYTLTPLGFEVRNGQPNIKGIFTLPPNLVKCKYTEEKPFFLFDQKPEGVKYTVEGYDTPLDGNKITHLNDNRVTVKEIDGKDILTGESKMKSLSVVIQNIRMAYESRGMILKYRGAQGILSPDGKDGTGMAMPFEKGEKENMQEAFRRYGTMSDQDQVIVTNTSSKFQSMTVNEPRKLGIFDECQEDFFRMCDTYGVDPDLFSSVRGATFENKNQARKGLYENTIIPEGTEWISAGLNKMLFPTDSKVKYIIDYMHLPLFQENMKERADTISALVNGLSRLRVDGQITAQEYREELAKVGIGDGKELPEEEQNNEGNGNNAQQANTGTGQGNQGTQGEGDEGQQNNQQE